MRYIIVITILGVATLWYLWRKFFSSDEDAAQSRRYISRSKGCQHEKLGNTKSPDLKTAKETRTHVEFITKDKQSVFVEFALISQLETIASIFEDLDAENHPALVDKPFYIPECAPEHVTKVIFEKIVEWLKQYEDVPIKRYGTAYKLTDFDRQFFSIDQEMLVKILLTADYFELTSLIDKWAKFNAMKIASMNVGEICAYFNITTDLTDYEMEELEEDLPWCDGRFKERFLTEKAATGLELKDLPEDFWGLTFSYLKRADLERISFIRKEWRDFIEDNQSLTQLRTIYLTDDLNASRTNWWLHSSKKLNRSTKQFQLFQADTNPRVMRNCILEKFKWEENDDERENNCNALMKFIGGKIPVRRLYFIFRSSEHEFMRILAGMSLCRQRLMKYFCKVRHLKWTMNRMHNIRFGFFIDPINWPVFDVNPHVKLTIKACTGFSESDRLSDLELQNFQEYISSKILAKSNVDTLYLKISTWVHFEDFYFLVFTVIKTFRQAKKIKNLTSRIILHNMGQKKNCEEGLIMEKLRDDPNFREGPKKNIYYLVHEKLKVKLQIELAKIDYTSIEGCIFVMRVVAL